MLLNGLKLRDSSAPILISNLKKKKRYFHYSSNGKKKKWEACKSSGKKSIKDKDDLKLIRELIASLRHCMPDYRTEFQFQHKNRINWLIKL